MTDGEKTKTVTKPSNISGLRASKKIKEKYKSLWKNKILSKKIAESNKKNKIFKEIETVEKVKSASEKKRDQILAKKILKKYRNLEKPKKTYLVEEKDIETIDYIEPQEDIFAGESILNAANKVLNLKQFKKEPEKLLKKGKKGKAIAAKNVLKKYKNMKKPKKTYLVNENDLETIDYSEPQEDLFAGESILIAANKVLNFKQFKKEQEKLLKKGKKGKAIAAKNLLKKYKNMKKPEKTYLVNENDLETIDYSEPQEDLFAGESILIAANKVLNFKQFKKEQEKLLKKGKSIAAKNVLKKYKNMKIPKKHIL